MQILSTLDHPNILKIHEAFEDKFKIYQVVDTLSSESLFSRIIRNGQLAEEQSQTLITIILAAVKYMHKNGLVHRNIRPEMILFSNE